MSRILYPCSCVPVTALGLLTLLLAGEPARGAIAVDANASTDRSTASTTVASPSFSTVSGNELLLAFIATDYQSGANTTVRSVAGAGLTWALVVRSNGQSGTSEIWRALAPARLSAAVVTATLSQRVVSSMTVMSFNGVDTSGTNGSGAIGATASTSAATGAPSATLLTTRNNSWVFGVGSDFDNAISRVPGAGQSLVHQDLAPVGDTYWVQQQANPTTLSGTSVTINDTAPTADRYNLAIVELLAPASLSTVPDLTITKTHSGKFVQGQSGAYTITVTNSGGAATSGTVTMTDALPTGLTATAVSGAGWTCTLATLTCTRSDSLAASANFPAVTLTVSIASNAPASLTNAATVSGGGETNTANDTASDITNITSTSLTGIKLIQSNFNGNESGTSNMSVSFTSNNTQGDFLIVTGSAARPASTLTISDTLGNVYSSAIGPVTDTTQNVTIFIWYVPTCKGGANTVTITPSTTAALEIHVSEWSGLASVSPVDQTASANGAGTSVSSGAQTTTANGELIFGYGWVFNAASAGAGFNPISLVNGDLDEYQIQNTAGSIAATFTQTSGTWFALMATFKPAGWSISGTITGGAGASVSLSGPSTASVTADGSGNYSFNNLVNGIYTITSSEPGVTITPASQTVTVNGANVGGINFAATQVPPVLSISPTSVVLVASQGGNNPPGSTVSVTNAGGGLFSFSASSDSSWLSVSPASGTSPQALQLSAATNGLGIGTYTGHVTITATGVQGSPASVIVTLYIGTATDWLMVDHDPSRSGYASDENIITNSNVGNLQFSWSAAVDGSVTAQPLFVHSILISGQTRDVLVVGTGGNSIYAFDAGTGAVLWTRNFGAPTPGTYGLPDGFGIEAPPVIDRVAGRIYTVSTDGVFRTISLLDGTDVYPGLTLVANPVTNKVWGGLNKVGNSVYVAVGSNGGDVAPWAGQVYRVDVSSVPTLGSNFVVVPSIPNGGGGIWGYGGVSADLATGTIFAASAFDSRVNSQGNEGYTPYADSMIALTSQLTLLGYYQPPQPSTFPCGGAPCDLDFASTPIFFQPAGCPTMVAAGNKNGNLYLFKVSDLMASGQPLQILTLNDPYDSIGLGGVAGVPAFSPVTNMLYIGDAGTGVTGVAAGLVALKFATNCTMQVAWSNPLSSGNDLPNSTPTIANGVVFIGEGKTGIVHAYDAQTGAELWQSGSQYHAAATFAAPIVAGGKVYAGSWSSFAGGGIVGAFSLNASSPILSVSPGTLGFSATAGGNNPAPATINVANSGTGTLSFSASSDSFWLTVSPLSGTAPLSVQASASINGLSAGTYTGHITFTAPGAQGSPAVVTVTLTVSSSGGGGTLAIDASVSTDSGSASSSITSPSFSTSAGNELLLAFVATDALSANMTVTSVTGAGLTWTLVRRTNTQSGTAEVWRAFAATSLNNAAVTANLAQRVASSITVMSFTGVDTSGGGGSGAIGATASASAASGAPSASLTTTRNNSWVFGVGNDYDNATPRTVGANQTLVHQYLAPVGDTYWVQRQNAAIPTSGTIVTINDTNPTGDRYNLTIVEVLPHL